MTRRLLLGPSVIGGIVAVEIVRRGLWLAWPILGTARAVFRRAEPTEHSELDIPA